MERQPLYTMITERSTVSEVEALAGANHKIEVSISAPVRPELLVALEKNVLRNRTDVDVRFYGFYKSACDLELLRHIHSVTHLTVNCLQGVVEGFSVLGRLPAVRTLKVGIDCLPSLSFLDELPEDLEVLYLEGAKKKNLSLRSIGRFQKLKRLYLEGHKTHLDSVGELRNLEELVLRSITVPALDFLRSLERLRLFDLKLGGTTNLDALAHARNLRELQIWQVRKLASLQVIKDIDSLEVFYLEDLPNVTSLPSLEHLKNLREVCISHLTGLRDISSIAKAPGLRTFALTDAGHCSAETFRPLLAHLTLASISVGLGSFRKNREVRDLFKGTQVLVGPNSAFGE